MGTVTVDGTPFDYEQNAEGWYEGTQNGLTVRASTLEAFEAAVRTGLQVQAEGAAITVVGTPEPDPISTAVTYKSEFWLRASDEEAVVLEGMLAAASPKMRGVFNGVQRLEHSSPLTTQLYADISSALGEPVAARLLAPSEG